jgi:hypothetical protein
MSEILNIGLIVKIPLEGNQAKTDTNWPHPYKHQHKGHIHSCRRHIEDHNMTPTTLPQPTVTHYTKLAS